MTDSATGPDRLLDFSDRVVVITGTASGIGAATLELLLAHGAVVHALDVAYRRPEEQAGALTRHHCDIGRSDSIDETLGRLPDRIDVLMNCAGVANGGRFDTDQVMAINWFGLRHLTEALLGRMAPGSSVVHVASTAGRDWASRSELHRELMAAHDFEAGMAWMDANRRLCGDGYVVSKEAVQYYTLWRSVQLLPRRIRMNSVCPGITATGLVDDFRRGMGDELIDHAAAVAGRFARPSEMAPAILFLADEVSSSYLNGVNLNIDRGTAAARLTDQADPAIIWGS
ncbi:MAG: coniferyl-alcohol dehydrogenase [Acidimicrobiia bacterium]|nr:coniferyl-alcohol dehydrogenase [Acidimicrobiia bacterium]